MPDFEVPEGDAVEQAETRDDPTVLPQPVRRDIETPEADAVEQAESPQTPKILPDDLSDDFREAPEADVLEQHQEEPLDDDYGHGA